MLSEADYHDIISGRRRGPAAGLIRGLLWGGSIGYGAFQSAKAGLYAAGLRRRIRVPRPVVVVGNLTTGGTGKTTSVIFLAQALQREGLRAGIILRGYGREDGPATLIVSDGDRITASHREAGDEALILAQALPKCPVAVGRSRVDVARRLIEACNPDVLLLDDGFGHLRLARDADVVLIDASRDMRRDRLFPAGTLREGPGALARASQLWITHSEMAEADQVTEQKAWLRRCAPRAPIVVAEHRPSGLRSIRGAEPTEGSTVITASGLGNPESFETSVRALGLEPAPVIFPDHHRYTEADWRRVMEAMEATGAKHVLTTEKDAVKLPPPPAGVTSLHVVGCELGIVEGHECIDDLLGMVKLCRNM